MENKIKIIKAIMLLLFILGGSGLCLADDKAQASDWYSPDWEYRKIITIDNISSGALTNYQVLITLNAGNFDYAKANEDGSDLRFTDSDKLTEISYWIEKWNATGDSEIWVKIPSVPASDTIIIYLYYGNASATTSLDNFDNTMQKLEVDDSTVALWHFDEGEGITIIDSSENANDGTMYDYPNNSDDWVDTGDWVADSAFSNGSAISFNDDGSGYGGEYVEVPYNDSLDFETGSFTIEGWVNIKATAEDFIGNIFEKWANNTGLLFEINSFQVQLVLQVDTDSFLDVVSQSINPDEWVHVVVVRDNTEPSLLESVQIYTNGQKTTEESEISPIGGPVNLPDGFEISGLGWQAPFNGFMDEFRISTRALSADEIKADYERRQYTPIEPTNILEAEEVNPYNVSETVVAGDGGTVTNTADTVTIDIPANALSFDTEVTIEANEAIGDFQVQGIAPIDYAYTFGPEGTTFSIPVTLTFDYDDMGMTLEEEQGLDIYLYNETLEIWETQGATVDTDLNILTLSVTHFSNYIVGKNITIMGKIDELLLLINNYYEEGKIEKSAYSLSVHLKRVQRLSGEEKIEKAVDTLEKFIEKVERFTPNKIDPDASENIILKANNVIILLQ